MNDLEKEINFVEERRIAPRYKVNLRASVLIMAIRKSAADEEQYLALQGRTRDVSESGLALIISNDDMKELGIFGMDWVIQLLLPLPSGAIELEVTPVRYQRLDETEMDEILVGTHITNMSGRDRVLFMEFIHECEASQQF